MRRVLVLAACVALSLVTAGCDVLTDRDYFRQGIGTELYTQNLPQVSLTIDQYVDEICQQAFPKIKDNKAWCDEAAFGPPVWTTFTYAGMNDIDRRCDAFLTWLDEKKRSRAPLLKQIADTQRATAAILDATSVGPHQMAIVAAAFGLAADSFMNASDRLLTTAEQTTVQAVVIGEQNKFRTELREQAISSKPQALYVLRRYMRICMPFTIETIINSTATIFQVNGAPGLNTKTPLLAPYLNASMPVTGTPGPKNTIPNPMGDEKNIPIEQAKLMQRGLLGTPTADGNFGDEASPTRMKIKEFKLGYGMSQAVQDKQRALAFNPLTYDGIVRKGEKGPFEELARIVQTCGNAGMFNSVFEAGAFMAMKNTKNRTPPRSKLGPRSFFTNAAGVANQKGLFTAEVKIPEIKQSPPDSYCKVDDDVRVAIVRMKQAYKIPNATNVVDEPLMIALMNAIKN